MMLGHLPTWAQLLIGVVALVAAYLGAIFNSLAKSVGCAFFIILFTILGASLLMRALIG